MNVIRARRNEFSENWDLVLGEANTRVAVVNTNIKMEKENEKENEKEKEKENEKENENENEPFFGSSKKKS